MGGTRRSGGELRLYARYRSALRRDGVRGTPPAVDGSVVRLPPAVRSLCGRVGGRVWPVADENTAIAACEYLGMVKAAPGTGTILPGSPRVVPYIETAEEIAAGALACDARLILVMGGGTLTDMAKYAAARSGLELACIPTAASVDAYNSALSALRIEGVHANAAARLPSAILVDPLIIRSAPVALTLSGLGDLIGKLIARLDWELAWLVTGEPFGARESSWSDRAARSALTRLAREGVEDAAVSGLDALLVTGEAMRVSGGSRPAASSEHTLAHLWEVAVPFAASDFDYHGLLVAAAARVVVPCYRRIFAMLAERGVDPRAPWPEEEERSMPDRIPPDMERFRAKMMEETGSRRLGAAEVAAHREAAANHRERLLALASESLDAAERGLDALERCGIDRVLPRIPDRWVLRGVEWVRYLRNRYSAFDLAWEQGWRLGEYFPRAAG